MKKYIKSGFLLATIYSVFSSVVVYAQSGSADAIIKPNSTISTIIDSVMGILESLVPLLIGATVVVFLYGVFIFIVKSSAGNAEGRKEGVNFMIFGIIGIAVMVSVWGLVAFVTNTLGVSTTVPQFDVIAPDNG